MCPILKQFQTVWKPNDSTWDTKLDCFTYKTIYNQNDPAFLSLSVWKTAKNVKFLNFFMSEIRTSKCPDVGIFLFSDIRFSAPYCKSYSNFNIWLLQATFLTC